MKFTWGYEMETIPGRVIAPPLLHDKISLTSSGNTAQWMFYGTRKEIIEWMRTHPQLVIEYRPYASALQQQQQQTELIFDLLAVPDEDQSYYQYLKSFVVSDYEHERVKCEIRPKLENNKDATMIDALLCRTITHNGVCLGDIADELEHQWNMPARSYYQQLVDMYHEQPAPCHVISSAGPSSIRVGDSPSLHVRPQPSSVTAAAPKGLCTP
ncbi:hypothetical protein BX666DRAFT_1906812 [Dichotomocladium elegans]|nr:hypothetical protein BX666DRAFT_1906812 [Dichotomocladium elegans]